MTWDVNQYPSHVIIDFHPIISKYSANTDLGQSVPWVADAGRGRQIFLDFLSVFPVHKFIESSLVLYYETIDQESLIFEYIEASLPDGYPAFDEIAEASELNWWIELMASTVTQEVDQFVRHIFEQSSIRYPYTDYLFSHWVNQTSAVLVHRLLP